MDWQQPEAEAFEADVRYHLRKLRAQHEAKRRFHLEQSPAFEPFDAGSLAEILARPPEPEMRIDGLAPWDGSVLLIAQRKTGKTTLTANWARSLLTGEPFLGRHEVKPLQGSVAILNYEVSGSQLARWLSDAGVPDDRCFVVNLRGRRNPLSHDDDRSKLAEYLRGHEVEALAVDPFGRAYTGTSQNDNGEVQQWLLTLDEFTRAEAGAKDLLLTAHAGWNGERIRGASALEDWGDALWNLTRAEGDEDSEGTRYFRATGRDVDIDEDALDYDDDTRTLTLSGHGSRKEASNQRKLAENQALILQILEANPEGLSGSDLRKLAGKQDKAFTAARDGLVTHGAIVTSERRGRGGGVLYSLKSPNPANPANPAKHSDSLPSKPGEPGYIEIAGLDGRVELEPGEVVQR